MRPLAKLLSTALAAAGLIVAAPACKPKLSGQAKSSDESAVDVPVTKVEQLPSPVVITVTGVIAPDETSQVAAAGGGKVLMVAVKRGQEVKAGDVLVRLDATSAALGAAEARANLELARAQRSQAEADCKRASDLFAQNAITKSQFERESMACTAALQQVAAAEARTQLVSKSVRDGVVRAPFAGVIADTWVAPGEFVAPGMRLVTLVDNDPLKVELSIAEAAVPKLRLGQNVELEAVAYKGKIVPATITRLGAEISRMTRAMTVEATLEGGSGLTPGMFVQARIAVDSRNAPAIPEAATIRRGQTWRVFAVVEGRLEERVVQLGPDPAPGKKSVLQGLAMGETVVANLFAAPSGAPGAPPAINTRIVDGARVKGATAESPASAGQPRAPAAQGR